MFRSDVGSLVKPDEITHRTDGKVENNVHSSRMQSIDKLLPFCQRSIMRIEKTEINGRVTWSQVSFRFGSFDDAPSACHGMFKKGVPAM